MAISPPLIGITTYSAPASWGVWTLPATLAPRQYVDAVAESGGAPVLLPCLPPAADLHATLVEPLHGLLLCGGPDIDPRRYGASSDPSEGPNDCARDAFELGLLESARARDIPVLGICRGMQMLNVASGGTLDQHLPTASQHAAGPGKFAEHDVEVEPGSRLAAAIGARASVLSYHHQGIRRLGSDLRVSARAADGEIEAIEDLSGRFRIGVLWHPEMHPDRSLFRAFVAASET